VTETVGTSRAQRAAEVGRRLFDARYAGMPVGRAVAVLAAVVVVFVVVSASSGPFKVAYTYAALAGIGAVALTTLQGWAGQGSLFVAGLFLVGGYSTAVIPDNLGAARVPLGILLAGLIGAIFGFICSLPARRLVGVYLLLGTLALQYVVGDAGNLYQSHHSALGGYPVDALLLSQRMWLVVTFVLLVLTVVYFRQLGRSRIGRAAVLIRNDLGLAQVSGVNVTSYLRWMFVVTSTVMAIGGAMETYYTSTVSYDAYGVNVSVQYLVMIVLFGLGSLWGAVGGAFFVIVLEQLLTQILAGSNGVSNNAAYVIELIYGIAGFIAVLAVSKARNPRPVVGAVPSPLTNALRAVHRYSSRRTAGEDGLAKHHSALGGLRDAAGESIATTRARLRASLSGATWQPDPVPHGPVPVTTTSGGIGVRLDRVSVEYGGAEAVSDVSLAIPAGSTVSLVGRNGAGKTSLLLSITGFPRDSGARLRFNSGVFLTRIGSRGSEVADITRMAPDRRSRLGVSFVPADGKVFPSLTVDEHIVLAARNAKRDEDEVRELLDVFADLRSGLGRQAGLLSGGQKQQLALLCALAGRPRVLVVDELTLGLAPSATERVVQALKAVRETDESPTLILAEQSVAVAFDLADLVCLIESGRLLEAGPPTAEFEARVRRTYVGMAEQSA
jgi:branched-chain amino acid transport system permease protein